MNTTAPTEARRDAAVETVLRVEDLIVELPLGRGRAANAVNGLSFALGKGEIFGIVGESGAGKSLAALSILRLVPPQARLRGRVWFRDRDLLALAPARLRAVRGNAISVIYQDPMTALNPVWTVGEQISETVRLHAQGGRRAAAERTLEVLELAQLPNPRRVAGSYPHELSGGMLQRALIALALSCRPEILIADEPTTALDVTVQAQILNVLLRLRDELGLSIILITHDMGVVARTADRVLVMYAGRAVESGGVLEVLREPLHPYTDALLRSVDLSAARGQLAAIPGAPPRLGAVPVGCPFHPRCGYAQAECAETEPELREAARRRRVACHFPLIGDRA
jgi:oligopeptide/dipeptide ABC transporter ATP-binding protein